MFFRIINNIFSDLNNAFYLRCFLAFFTSLLVGYFSTKVFINILKAHAVFQPIRTQGPEGHLITKQKTPTMGGLPMMIAFLISSLFFADLKKFYIFIPIITALFFGIIGLIDDYIKIFIDSKKGFRGSIKIVIEIFFVGLIILFLQQANYLYYVPTVTVPIINYSIYIGFLIIPFFLAVISGSSNGVNMTDGLDGLAIVPFMLVCFALSLISVHFNDVYQQLAFENLKEISVLCSAMIGAGLAFFYFNHHPAKIFMGDVGSLMLGAFLGVLAVILRCEIAYAIMALLFVIESISVILQVASYKLTGKRIFKMAPIHHHFEKCGWSETKIIYVFWTFSAICTLIGFYITLI